MENSMESFLFFRFENLKYKFETADFLYFLAVIEKSFLEFYNLRIFFNHF